MKNVLLFAFAVVLGGAIMLGGMEFFDIGVTNKIVSNADTPVHFTLNPDTENGLSEAKDFTTAADKTLPAVVHIRSSVRVPRNDQAQSPFDFRNLPDPFRDFFGTPQPQERGRQERPMRQGTGSGVIISSDGYIVTNNHVIDDAEDIEVTLHDKRNYSAKVVGVDPSTDIALLRINVEDLSFIQFANSDQVKVGEWAVAVGNPFNLASTVTAGIVSAKGRNINIMRDRTPIESFIQTDAAVNPGNSGGALVNLQGDLIGINTAIASPTGSYSGYAFAVPSNMVYKVVTDLKEYGVVQRGFIGALIRDVNGAMAEDKGLDINAGVYVDSLTGESAAAEAGMKVGDVIVEVEGVETAESSVLLEMIGRHRPGDVVKIKILRDGNEKDLMVTLKNRDGNTEVVAMAPKDEIIERLGASFANASDEELEALDLSSGVKVVRLGRGKLRAQTNMEEGFIITRVNRQRVSTVEDLVEMLENEKGGIMIEGRYPGDDETFYYAFGL